MPGTSGEKNHPRQTAQPALFRALAHTLLPFLLGVGCSGNDAGTPSSALLREVTSEVGLGEEQQPWPDGLYQIPEISVGGIGLFDSDGDSSPEIYQVRYPQPANPSQAAPNRLYRMDKTGSYREVPELSLIHI